MNRHLDTRDLPNETLWQAMAAIGQRQFVAFLVIWLAVGFPVICQQHGLMTFMEADQHAAHAVTPPDTSPESQSACSMRQHDSTPRMVMTLTTIGLTPDIFTMTVSNTCVRLLSTNAQWPVQLCIRPPVPPPRSV